MTGVWAPQAVVAGSAVTGFVPSPAESETAACTHDVEVSVTVNVTAKGAFPEVGATERDAVTGPTVVVPPPGGVRSMPGLVGVVVGIKMPHGSDVGIGEMYRVPVHVGDVYPPVDV